MIRTCPNCQKTLTGPPGAVFCMYCGHRLRPGDTTPLPAGPDPDATADLATRAFDPGPTGPEDTPPDSPPQRVGSYRLLRMLGAGGMGTVFEAESDDGGDRVAVKLLSPKLAANPTSVERFRQEGRLASQITHPRCVFVYGADTDAGRPFIVMELMPGATLKDLVDRRGPLPVAEAVARILDVIDGLTEAHRLGVIHRDVKPSNCFVTADDRVKVGDFGLSKSLDGAGGDKQLTTTGAFLGTVLFAPPEQLRGEEVGYDSDVYSVCATLYYLLTGQAPYQHESVTAALAKAISEPPPPVRSKRPDVPRGLDRAVLRGLERDRNRRWGSLEELRDALADQLPGRQLPPRPRAVIGAYLIDLLLVLLLVQTPLEILDAALDAGLIRPVLALGLFDPVGLALATAAFALFEGVAGATPGKWLLRLRVSRVGQVGPPGVRAAAVRAAVFALVFWVGTLSVPFWLLELPYLGVPVGLAAFAAGAYATARQLRASREYRGLHDLASGCQIVQRPRPTHRVRLLSRGPNPLDRPAPARPPLPAAVGGFAVRGKLLDRPGGEMVWVAEDRSLGRRILLWVRPAAAVADEAVPTAVRPTRLRAVSAGDVIWNGESYWWVAFVAPAGAPLPDVVDPDHPLPWADARLLIEQVVDELIAAGEDGSLPGRLGVDQIWVEPSGRIHLLDFPVATAAKVPPPAADPLGLVRQVTTLLLEGAAREGGGRVAAPVPPHASRLTDRLFAAADADPDVRAIQAALAETHAHPAQVTGSMRAAHVGLTGTLAGVGLGAMFAAALAYHLWGALIAAQNVNQVRAVRDGIADPAVRAAWAADPDVRDYLVPDRLAETGRRLEAFEAAARQDLEGTKRVLTRPERFLVERTEPYGPWAEGGQDLPPRAARHILVVAQRPERYGGRLSGQRAAAFGFAATCIAFFVASFVAAAFVFRGGLSYLLAGLAIVRRDGRRAGRFRCALRELLAWLPVVAVLAAAVWVQATWPDWGFGRAIAAFACAAVLIAGAALAVRYPERGLHDRLAGTYVVPA